MHSEIMRMYELLNRHRDERRQMQGEAGMLCEYAVWFADGAIVIHVWADNADEANDKAVYTLNALLNTHGHEGAVTTADISSKAELA